MKAALLGILAVTVLLIGGQAVFSASQESFGGASAAVQNAFVAVQSAGNDGGNVTSLVEQLNSALALVQKASAENSSNPGQASADLQSALGIAQGVQASAGSVAQQGMAARQLQLEISIVSAVAIVGIAVALYVYGDRLYHRLWLRIYGDYVVKTVG